MEVQILKYAEVQLAICPGLPDFSLFNIPKRGKYTDLPVNVPNCGNIFQMAKENINFLFQGTLKFTQTWKFWFENIPSGNPVFATCVWCPSAEKNN
jgi:hypothetical protein